MRCLVACLVAAVGFLESTAAELPDVFKPGELILFTGDSITHGGRMNDMNHYLGHGYQAEIAMRYLAYRPDLGLEFANRGVSGDTTSNLVVRWRGDAVPLRRGANGEAGVCGWKSSAVSGMPDVISILVGINDYLGRGRGHVSSEDYERNLRFMVTNSLAASPKTRIVLCEPFRLPVDSTPDFLARQAAVRKLAEDYNLVFVPFQHLFADILLKECPRSKYWFWDAYHPTYAAHMRMADFWLETVASGFAKGRGRPCGAVATAAKDELAKLVAEDLKHEVRPGGVNGQPFWNKAARFFMYPPAFEFPGTKTAVRYRFEVVDAGGKTHVFEAKEPTASLAPVWPELPTGWTSVMCLAVDKVEDRTLLRGSRTFWKQAPFTGDYPPAKCNYAEFSKRAKEWLFSQPAFKKFLETRDIASCNYWALSYPSKMIAAIVSALCSGTPTKADLEAARAWADWLYERAEKPDRPLAYFPPTYWKTPVGNRIADLYEGQVMLAYPSGVGGAMLKLAEKTGDRKYSDWALGIGETYLKLQGEDGSWFLKMYLESGKEVNPNRLMPLGTAMYLETLYEKTKDVRYRTAADRAFTAIDKGPMRTWNWEGQFEDIEPDLAYRDLTKHGACSTAMFLLDRYPGDKTRLAQARELLRFAEDQFVCWEKPFPDMPESHNLQKVADWVLPGALEQYYWYVPIDASASKLIYTYLALYKAEGNPLDLAKARALGDTMTRIQKPDGDVPTHWGMSWEKGCSWWNCLLSDVGAMNTLAEYDNVR